MTWSGSTATQADLLAPARTDVWHGVILTERARELCAIAHGAVQEARLAVAESRRLREARARWRDIWLDYCLQAAPVLVCCAFCARIRGSGGRWDPVPLPVSDFLHHHHGIKLSHGYCPDCVARHFPG